ncbi:hypothetical protein [Neobacillus jeddahensis]|uniref:hypothetical protein n=1 Tax=Neobacillus jeddahensis TaxID=1461580 RepID=UPI00058B379D|nr:hypothetical protein [Neobacillus jeddahensis]
MAVTIIFIRIFALILFMAGIWMGSTIDSLFGVITILGGLLLGFSSTFENSIVMNKKSKVFLYTSFVFLLSLMSLAYLAMVHFYL